MRIGPQRPVNPDAIVAPQGYRVEALITGLTFPSAISFGPGGELYLAESGGALGAQTAVSRVLRIDPDQSVNEIGRLEDRIVGLEYRNGGLLIGEDGPSPRILRVTAEGELQVLLEGLPGGGDYGLSGLSLDASGALLFGLGTRTNSGVVGLDNLARGWVTRNPDWADVAGADLELEGVNYVTSQPVLRGAGRAVTGGLKPFGRRSEAGETVKGGPRCGGAVYRLAPDQPEPERLAWGLRNPVGVICGPDGRLFATEGGMEDRGSRPIAGAPDNLWEVGGDSFHGWPDYASGVSVTDPRFRLPGLPQPRPLLRQSPSVSRSPVATFACRSGVGRLDFSTSEEFGFVGDALVALSGEWSAPTYAGGDSGPSGHRIVRVDVRTGEAVDFLVNRQASPSSATNSGGLERPFDIRFDPTGEVLYVVDMGEIQVSRENGFEAYGGTGVVWRISKIRPMLLTSAPPPAVEKAEPPAAEEAPALESEPEVEPVAEFSAPVEDEPTPEAEEAPASETEYVPAEADAEDVTAEEPDTVPGEEEAPAPEPEAVEPAAGVAAELAAEPEAPEGEAPVAEEAPETEVPVAEEAPETEAPAVEEAVAEVPETAAPAETEEPAPAVEPEEPAAAEPAAEEPAAAEPAATEPLAAEPEPVEEAPEPVTEEPAPEEPAAAEETPEPAALSEEVLAAAEEAPLPEPNPDDPGITAGPVEPEVRIPAGEEGLVAEETEAAETSDQTREGEE